MLLLNDANEMLLKASVLRVNAGLKPPPSPHPEIRWLAILTEKIATSERWGWPSQIRMGFLHSLHPRVLQYRGHTSCVGSLGLQYVRGESADLPHLRLVFGHHLIRDKGD